MPDFCLLCDEQSIPTYFCNTCCDKLCDGCFTAHKRVKITKNHELVPIETNSKTEEVEEIISNLAEVNIECDIDSDSDTITPTISDDGKLIF